MQLRGLSSLSSSCMAILQPFLLVKSIMNNKDWSGRQDCSTVLEVYLHESGRQVAHAAHTFCLPLRGSPLQTAPSCS